MRVWRSVRPIAASALALLLTACAAPPEVVAPAPAASVAAAPVAIAVPPPPAAEPTPAPQPPPEKTPESAPEEAPEPPATQLLDEGLASWYGPGLHGRRTASGERFNRFEFTAAHRTLPFGTRVCVRSLMNGKTVMVRINDRGPFGAGERVVDLSQAAAKELGMVGLGIKPVQLWQVDEGDTGCTPALGDEAAGAREAAAPADQAPASTQWAAPSKSIKAR